MIIKRSDNEAKLIYSFIVKNKENLHNFKLYNNTENQYELLLFAFQYQYYYETLTELIRKEDIYYDNGEILFRYNDNEICEYSCDSELENQLLHLLHMVCAISTFYTTKYKYCANSLQVMYDDIRNVDISRMILFDYNDHYSLFDLSFDFDLRDKESFNIICNDYYVNGFYILNNFIVFTTDSLKDKIFSRDLVRIGKLLGNKNILIRLYDKPYILHHIKFVKSDLDNNILYIDTDKTYLGIANYESGFHISMRSGGKNQSYLLK